MGERSKRIVATIDSFNTNHKVTYLKYNAGNRNTELNQCIMTMVTNSDQSTRTTLLFTELEFVDRPSLLKTCGFKIHHVRNMALELSHDDSSNHGMSSVDRIEIWGDNEEILLTARLMSNITPR